MCGMRLEDALFVLMSPLFLPQPIGDESQARVVEVIGQKPGDLCFVLTADHCTGSH